MHPTQARILNYLADRRARYISVSELSRECRQTDVRKRVSELIRDGYPIEKKRYGRFVLYRLPGRSL